MEQQSWHDAPCLVDVRGGASCVYLDDMIVSMGVRVEKLWDLVRARYQQSVLRDVRNEELFVYGSEETLADEKDQSLAPAAAVNAESGARASAPVVVVISDLLRKAGGEQSNPQTPQTSTTGVKRPRVETEEKAKTTGPQESDTQVCPTPVGTAPKPLVSAQEPGDDKVRGMRWLEIGVMIPDEPPVDSVESLSLKGTQLDLIQRLAQGTDHVGSVIKTPTISAFWHGYGEFPDEFFVRGDAVMSLQSVVQVVLEGSKKVAFFGPCGVGKSCLLALVAIHVAFVEQRRVCVVKKLNGGFCCVVLGGKAIQACASGRVALSARWKGLTAYAAFALARSLRSQGHSIFIDDVAQQDVPVDIIDFAGNPGYYDVLRASRQSLSSLCLHGGVLTSPS